MNSSALQNPSDPYATYRNKAGKLHRGYVANLEETVSKTGSVVTDYQYDKNIHIDSQFLQESLNAMDKSDEEIILIINHIPRGKQRGKFFFGGKIAALNFRKLFTFRKGLGNYALNPALD